MLIFIRHNHSSSPPRNDPSASSAELLPHPPSLWSTTHRLGLPMVVCVECLSADTPPWDVVYVTRRSSGVASRACVRVYARVLVLVPSNLYIHTHIHVHVNLSENGFFSVALVGFLQSLAVAFFTLILWRARESQSLLVPAPRVYPCTSPAVSSSPSESIFFPASPFFFSPYP